jgi:pimeloyl-ACP methyl ester carboxylesterase
VHGWPETWYAWRLLMPALARGFEVIAVDQRGIGLTDKPEGGYDSGTLAGDLVALMDALGHERFAVVGHDTGYIISYALAADHPHRIARVALAEIPGPPVASASPPLFVPGPVNNRLWHIPFNRVDKVPEKLVRGREDIFFGYEFAIQTGNRGEAARRRGRLLRPYPLQPRRPARLLRVVPRVGHHARTERAAHDPAADDARPGDRRSGKLG